MESKSMEKTIIEGNRAIAEFMGAKAIKYRRREGYYWQHESLSYPHGMSLSKPLDYLNNWGRIMGVMDKIDKFTWPVNLYTEIYGDNQNYGCKITSNNWPDGNGISVNNMTSKIEAVWQAVVDFISWYNSQGVKPAK